MGYLTAANKHLSHAQLCHHIQQNFAREKKPNRQVILQLTGEETLPDTPA